MPRLPASKSDDHPDLRAEMMTVPVMTGTHFHSLDDKGRIIIPAKLRSALTEHFWMILDENDNVAMYDYKTGRDVLVYCERLQAQNPGDEFIASAVERITGAAEEITMESDAWRVPIPDILRYYAELDKDVVTVGVLNKAVIWSRDRWERAQKERLQQPEVRKAQAEMLRAAASGVKLPPGNASEEKVDDSAARGTGAAEIGPTGDERAVASAGDGGRGNRLLTLSQLGR